MAKKPKELANKKPLNRTPEESVKVASGKMNTKITPGVNDEIKDIVDDILNGKLKTVMDSEVGKKIGMNKSKHKIKENANEPLDEKELIMGEKETTDSSGEKQFKRKEHGVTDYTKGGHAKTVGQKPGESTVQKVIEKEDLPKDEQPVSENENNIESRLSEMGYDLDTSFDVPGLESEKAHADDTVELDLNSIGYDASEIESMEENNPNDIVVDDEPPMEKPGMDKPVMNEPPMEKPGMDKPVMNEPPMEEPGMDKPVMDKPVMDEPAPSDLDAEPEVDDTTPIGASIEVAEIGTDELTQEDQEEIQGWENEIQTIRDNLVAELEQIGEAVLPKELQEKLQIKFEMLAETKAKIIATKKVATVIDKTNDYMEYVVKEFIDTKEKEIKEAVNSAKKVEIYENFKQLVEGLYGKDTNTLMEAKRTEDFLVNVIAEMKKEREALKEKIEESNETIQQMQCKIIFNEATKNLTLMDKEKVASFVESFEYKNPSDFQSKLKMIIESFNSIKKGQSVKKEATQPKKAPEKQTKPLNEGLIEKAVAKKQKFDASPSTDVEEVDPDRFNSFFYSEGY